MKLPLRVGVLIGLLCTRKLLYAMAAGPAPHPIDLIENDELKAFGGSVSQRSTGHSSALLRTRTAVAAIP